MSSIVSPRSMSSTPSLTLQEGMVTGDGLQVPPVFALNTASPWSLACVDYVEYGNVPWAAGVYPPLIPGWDVNTPAVASRWRILANASWGKP